MISRAMAFVPARFATFFSIPILRRAAFHVKRLTSGLDASFFTRVGIALLGVLIVSAAVVDFSERNSKEHSWHTAGGFFREFGGWFYWCLATVMSAGASDPVTTILGYIIGWLLILF